MPIETILARRLGDRFHDVRAQMPRHQTLQFGSLNPANLIGIAAHHTAASREQTALQVAEFHITKPDPFAGIGYHFLVRLGHVYYVGDVNTQRAHVAGRNDVLLGACMTGDYAQIAPHSADALALKEVVLGIDEWLGRKLPVNGHNEWSLEGHGTKCPGAFQPVAQNIRTDSAPAQPPPAQPPSTQPKWGTLVWYAEEIQRAYEAVGEPARSKNVGDNVTRDLISRRDRR